MIRRVLVFATLLTFGVETADSIDLQGSGYSSTVEVVATLLTFSEGGVWYDFSDHAENYHFSQFVVLSPLDYCGKKLQIQHIRIPETQNSWQETGRTFKISIYAAHADYLLRNAPETSISFFMYPDIRITEEVSVESAEEIGCELSE